MSPHQKQEVSHDPQRSSSLGHRARRGRFCFACSNSDRLGGPSRQRSSDRDVAGRHIHALAERAGSHAGLGRSGGAEWVDVDAGCVSAAANPVRASSGSATSPSVATASPRTSARLIERACAYSGLRDIAIRRRASPSTSAPSMNEAAPTAARTMPSIATSSSPTTVAHAQPDPLRQLDSGRGAPLRAPLCPPLPAPLCLAQWASLRRVWPHSRGESRQWRGRRRRRPGFDCRLSDLLLPELWLLPHALVSRLSRVTYHFDFGRLIEPPEVFFKSDP